MSYITQNSVENIIQSATLEKVIGKLVELKKNGANYTGRCPFHEEKTASFSVSPSKNMYKCFGCGAGGSSAVWFVMALKHLSWPEAMKWIAAEFNIQIEYEEATQDMKETRDKMERLYECNQVALEHFVKQMPVDDPDHPLRQLLWKRKIAKHDIEDFKLGYAPDDWKLLTTQLQLKGYFAEGVELGLIKKSEDKDNYYDFFRNRIIIPVFNKAGRVVAFGGRAIAAEEKAKYLNSPQSPVYHKSSVLYGMNTAYKSIADTKTAYLVEGYFDVTGMHKAGGHNTVGSCGTSVTTEQLKELRRYAETLVFVMDGDDAGKKSFVKSLPMALREGFKVKVTILPQKSDPDDFCRKYYLTGAGRIHFMAKDAIETVLTPIFEAAKDPESVSSATFQASELLANIPQQVRRNAYTRDFAKKYKAKGVKEADIRTTTEDKVNERVIELAAVDQEAEIPAWANRDSVYTIGFAQKNEASGKDRVGVYFLTGERDLKRLTNFTIAPLFHIVDANNGRRLIEIFNGYKRSVVEMQNRCFIEQSAFEGEIISKGAFYTEPGFGRPHFKRMMAWTVESMPAVYELSSLGWQPEGFFAFSNMVYGKDGLVEYNEYGVVKIKDRNYLSPGVSKTQEDERHENNIYENDLYLKYVKSSHDFKSWSALFKNVYGKHADMGIAFVFITVFKDLATRVTKCPHLYCYGPKGSGKSAFAESLMWLFFSGKNAEKKLIQGFNLNPGQSTQFSFYSSMERFMNCPRLYNEYDPGTIEFWKKGAFKAAYDGEGREVGSGETGKKRKTKIQKVQGTCMLAGQYLDTTDDGSVLSRSLPLSFSLEENKKRTEKDKENYALLSKAENKGLSSIITELMQFRDYIKENLADEFTKVNKSLNQEARQVSQSVEIRLLNSYSLALSFVKLLNEKITLPFKYSHFYSASLKNMLEQSALLKDNNALQAFFRFMEVLLDQNVIRSGYEFRIERLKSLTMKVDNKVEPVLFEEKEVLLLRFTNVYNKYAKGYREIHNKVAPTEATLIDYLKDQPYFIGLCNQYRFKDKNTSCYALDYQMLEVDLERFEMEEKPAEKAAPANQTKMEETAESDAPW